jgi:hypothetical protein
MFELHHFLSYADTQGVITGIITVFMHSLYKVHKMNA